MGSSGLPFSPTMNKTLNQRAHTGFDFDYTPREASRLERRSSRSKTRISETGSTTPRASGSSSASKAPGSPSKIIHVPLDGESNAA